MKKMKKMKVISLICFTFIFFNFQNHTLAKHCKSPSDLKCVCKHHPNRPGCKKKKREYLAQASGGVCSIPEGTYVGKAVVKISEDKTEKRPFFIVVANKKIAGFYAPADQRHPQGATINQTEVNSGFNFFISMTSKGDFLNFNVSGQEFPNGKTKLINAMGAVPFRGYFLPQPDESDIFGHLISNGGSGDFINIGKDGGTVARVTVGMDNNFFFGKINQNGDFVQVFPDEDNGPSLSLHFIGIETDVNVKTLDGKLAKYKWELKEDTSCAGGSSVDSTLANELLVQAFKQDLGEFKSAFLDLGKATGKKANKEDIKILTLVKNYLKTPSKVCKVAFIDILGRFEATIKSLQDKFCSVNNKEGCYPDDIATSFVSKMSTTLAGLREKFNTDDDEDGQPDICDKDVLIKD